MAQLGNKQNCYLNGEWGKHVKKFTKRYTARARRQIGKEEIRNSEMAKLVDARQ